MLEAIKNKNLDYYTGIEINEEEYTILKIRSEIIEKEITLKNEDMFKYSIEEKFDKIFMNSPLDINRNVKILNLNDFLPIEIKSRTNNAWLYIFKMLKHLKKGW